jgi:hypothetical protein
MPPAGGAPDVVVAVPRVPPPRVEVLTEDLRVLKVTVSRLARLEAAKMALSHRFREGRFEDVIGTCIEVFLEQDARQHGRTPPKRAVRAAAPRNPAPTGVGQAASTASAREDRGKPASGGLAPAETVADIPPRLLRRTRYVPVAVLRAVWARDGGCCSFRGPDGHVRRSRYRLELGHLQPWALGGQATEANLAVRCHMHNQYRARQTFGAEVIERARRARRQHREGRFHGELNGGADQPRPLSSSFHARGRDS